MSKDQSSREEFASRFLKEAVRFLRSQNPSERNKAGIEIAGTSAWFLSGKSLFRELEQIWNDTPKSDYRAVKSFEELVLAKPYIHEHTVMSKQEFTDYLQKLAPERFETCSNNDLNIEDVLQSAKSPLDVEELGCTYAVLDNYEMALKIASQSKLEAFRRDGILRIIEMEKLRKGNFDNPDLSILGLRDWGADPWLGGYVAMCVLGRLPYMGYPYPDW